MEELVSLEEFEIAEDDVDVEEVVVVESEQGVEEMEVVEETLDQGIDADVEHAEDNAGDEDLD